MKKVMMLACLFSFAAAPYALGSVIWDAKIVSACYYNGTTSCTVTETEQAAEEQTAQTATAKRFLTAVTVAKKVLETKIKENQLSAESQQIAKEAERKLNALIKYNGNFKLGLQTIIAKHEHLVKVIDQRSPKDQVLEEGNIALKDLIVTIHKLNYEPLIDQVWEIIDHKYYFPLRNPNKLIDLPRVGYLKNNRPSKVSK